MPTSPMKSSEALLRQDQAPSNATSLCANPSTTATNLQGRRKPNLHERTPIVWMISDSSSSQIPEKPGKEHSQEGSGCGRSTIHHCLFHHASYPSHSPLSLSQTSLPTTGTAPSILPGIRNTSFLAGIKPLLLGFPLFKIPCFVLAASGGDQQGRKEHSKNKS